MIIHRLKIVGLYGFLDKDISFNSKINLLVGINGTGKTSILTIINWLIRPALPELCTTEFSLLEIEFSEEDIIYTIRCSQTEDEVTIEVLSQDVIYAPLPIELKTSTKKYPNLHSGARESIYESYTGLTPTSLERHKTWDFLTNLPDPTNVSLDRQLYLEDNDRVYIEASHLSSSSRYRRNAASKKPNAIYKVNEIFRYAYDSYRKDLISLNEELRNKLLFSLFEPESIESTKMPKLSLKQVNDLEKRVKKYFRESFSDNNQAISAIDTYFKNIEQGIAKASKSQPNTESLEQYAKQFKRVNALLSAFNDYEKRATKSYSQIGSYLSTVNSFFRDSSKKINFENESGRLYFDVLDEKNHVIQPTRKLSNLSSGEQQLLILLTYIAFSSKSGKTLIIDEPEISLHPKWQEDFIDAAEKLLHNSTQLIMATHSPAIVGRHRDYCVVLFPNETEQVKP